MDLENYKNQLDKFNENIKFNYDLKKELGLILVEKQNFL